jgi:hypothetical protein
MSNRMTVFTLAMVAGGVFPAAALAQRGVLPQSQAARTVKNLKTTPLQIDGVRYPDVVRTVRYVNGQIVPTSEWRPYQPRGETDGPGPQYVFDAMQNTGGITPGTQPAHGFWLLGFTAGQTDYSTSVRAHSMAGIPNFAWNQGAKWCDVLIQERNGTQPLYFAIFTAETHDPANPPGPTWGLFDGIQFGNAAGFGTGFWFFPLNVSTEPPPVGDGWRMPADGSGAYIVITSRDAAGTVPATGSQTGLWGTGDHLFTPPVPPMVGTQGPVEWADDSTPPQCGAVSAATNFPNLILDSAACESFDAFFGVEPDPLATAIGFGMVPGTPPVACYPNCDGSTTVPFLNVLDFSCFLNKFASGNTYANCDQSTTAPILNVLDFSCFLNKFAAGCSAP